MQISSDEFHRVRERIERRVRGAVLFRVHIVVAVLGVILGLIAAGSSSYGYYNNGLVLLALMMFGSSLTIHTAIRWVNRMADEMRRREMQKELGPAAAKYYYGSEAALDNPYKTKRGNVLLSEDGELNYLDDNDQSVSYSRSAN